MKYISLFVLAIVFFGCRERHKLEAKPFDDLSIVEVIRGDTLYTYTCHSIGGKITVDKIPLLSNDVPKNGILPIDIKRAKPPKQ